MRNSRVPAVATGFLRSFSETRRTGASGESRTSRDTLARAEPAVTMIARRSAGTEHNRTAPRELLRAVTVCAAAANPPPWSRTVVQLATMGAPPRK